MEYDFVTQAFRQNLNTENTTVGVLLITFLIFKTMAETSCILGNEKVKFPVTYELKLMVTTGIPIVMSKDGAVQIFDDLKIPYTFLNEKLSSKGNYSSLTYRVTLIDKLQMDELYTKLRHLPALKVAI